MIRLTRCLKRLICSFPFLHDHIQLSPEVEFALENGLPVVSLESTIITHGMPYPSNVATALLVEETVREFGAVPATIGILNGKIHVGMEESEIEFMGENQKMMEKGSRRDLASIIAMNRSCGTTVAATMILSHMAGIPIFVTGGIGGVHRGAEDTFDISADLTELGRTPICVVSGGVKSILDIPRTLEVLETNGVTVMGYQTSTFPAFFCRESTENVPLQVDSPSDVAQIIHTNLSLNLCSGMLVAVPVPLASELMKFSEMEHSIQTALTDASKLSVSGKDVTPFILQRLVELTNGQSLTTNIDLILNSIVDQTFQ